MPQPPSRWFDKSFPRTAEPEAVPHLIELLRAAPAALVDRLACAARGSLTRRDGTAWSIQEHAGHLGDLEPLWLRRIDDFVADAGSLTPADLDNRITWSAGHNARELGGILDDFRKRREALVDRFASLAPADWARTAVHPRLRTVFRLLDHLDFIVAHDAHHLALIDGLLAPQR